jgi:replicative superfamily II helicase
MYLRTLISELSLTSGSEYEVHFLIHVKDDNKQIWADEELYQEVLKNALPAEFAGMGTLWSERQIGLIYGRVEESNYHGLPTLVFCSGMPLYSKTKLNPEIQFALKSPNHKPNTPDTVILTS